MTQQATSAISTKQLYYVTLRWPQDDEGSFSQYVLASDFWEACVNTAQKMAEAREEDSEGRYKAFEDQADRDSWVADRAADSMECCLVADSLKSDLAELFAADLFPDGFAFDIDIEALRTLVAANRELLRAKPSIPKLALKFKMVDSGNCRVYYTDPNKRLLCFQLASRKKFELLYCTQEGEPSHTIDHLNKVVLDFPLSEPGIAADFIEWWELVNKPTPTVN
ncbi:hypothetical protein [Pseudomonas savastanoi]|uniref:hypothetical protein n=1 Tax=Pseudomonas savastanoi TaxID=29438 RepID=UPI0013C30F06|nr:hypothetical protein [Pseudomonas savastanoi]